MNDKPILDLESALERVEGDRDLYLELIELIKEQFKEYLPGLERAIRDADSKQTVSIAHTLKGALLNMGAERCAGVAFSLERLGGTGDLSKAPELLQQLKEEFVLVDKELDNFVSLNKDSK